MPEAIDLTTRIAVYGAGSIGCFIGGLLAHGGRRVTLLARPWMSAELAANGLTLTDLAGLSAHLTADKFGVQTSPDCLGDAGIILLTVKSGDTASAATEIATYAGPDVPVVSLQNGVDNPGVLRATLGSGRVLAGLVEFNVVNKGKGCFHRGSSGAVEIEAGRPDIAGLLTVPGLAVKSSPDIGSLQWGKLLFNLNNGLNALSDIPLRSQLQSRAWRLLLAAQIAEALKVLKAAGIRPKGANAVPLAFVPSILRLPDALFGLAARPLLQVDPEARSSMWEDLKRGRVTEIGEFQGAVAGLARHHGMHTPVSEAVFQLVKAAEASRSGPPGLSPETILHKIRMGED